MTRRLRNKLIRRLGLGLALVGAAAMMAPAAEAATRPVAADSPVSATTSTVGVQTPSRPVAADSPIVARHEVGVGSQPVAPVIVGGGDSFAYGDALMGAAVAVAMALLMGIGLLVRRDGRLAVG